MPACRFPFSLLLSVMLHLAVFVTAEWLQTIGAEPSRPTAATITATLLLQPDRQVESLLKDTLAETPRQAIAASRQTEQPGPGRQRSQLTAERKLAEHVYYPEEAIARGLEGEVRLLLTLDANGAVIEAQVADSSGHAVLDQAALRAAYAMGALTGIERREIILPVRFRLRP
jgi:protein TonB